MAKKDLNAFRGIGRLGKDSVTAYTPAGKMRCSFSVAMGNEYKNSAGETVKETYWQQCQVWGEFAQAIGPYLKKGTQVYFEGPLRLMEWDDDQGVHQKMVICKVDTLQLLGSPSGNGENHDPAGKPAPAAGKPADDDIPF